MNSNQLEYFISAAELLNFTKAANECCISQTAMTQQIQNLERSVGVPLFIRDKHHVELTAAGEVYLKEARAIIKKSDEAIRLARMATELLDGEITVGFISGFGQTDCYEVLRGFIEAYPNIKLKLYRDTMSGLLNALERGECDIAFCVQPHQKESGGYNHLYMKSYAAVVALGHDHPLANEQMITCEQLANEKFIIMQPSGRARDEMEEMLWVYEKGGFLPNVVAVEKEPETIMLLVSLGLGICIFPEYVARLYQRNEAIKIVPLVGDDNSAETLDFEMIWLKDSSNPAVEKLVDWLEEKC